VRVPYPSVRALLHRKACQVVCCAGPIAYLSSPSLLNLQLQDVTFRRHHLVQIAMLLHFAVTSRESPDLQVWLPESAHWFGMHGAVIRAAERVVSSSSLPHKLLVSRWNRHHSVVPA
jgi:THO complex subunit 1 transcription elongation factor